MRRLVIAFAIVLAIVLAVVPAAHAQQVADSPRDSARAAAVARLPVGALLRVRTAEPGLRYHVGTLLAADAGGLLLQARRDTVHVPAAYVRVVERGVGRRTGDEAFLRGAGRGLLVGLAVGTVATTITAIVEEREGCGDCFISSTAVVGALSIVFTGATTIIGGLGGLAHREIWEREWPARR